MLYIHSGSRNIKNITALSFPMQYSVEKSQYNKTLLTNDLISTEVVELRP